MMMLVFMPAAAGIVMFVASAAVTLFLLWIAQFAMVVMVVHNGTTSLLTSIRFPDMENRCMDDFGNMVVVNRVINLLSVFSEFYDPSSAEYAKLVGNSGLGKADDFTQIADAQLTG